MKCPNCGETDREMFRVEVPCPMYWDFQSKLWYVEDGKALSALDEEIQDIDATTCNECGHTGTFQEFMEDEHAQVTREAVSSNRELARECIKRHRED